MPAIGRMKAANPLQPTIVHFQPPHPPGDAASTCPLGTNLSEAWRSIALSVSASFVLSFFNPLCLLVLSSFCLAPSSRALGRAPFRLSFRLPVFPGFACSALSRSSKIFRHGNRTAAYEVELKSGGAKTHLKSHTFFHINKFFRWPCLSSTSTIQWMGL